MSTAAGTDKVSTVPDPTRHSVSRYDCFAQFTHWLTVLVLIATFATVWLIGYADTREQANAL